MSPEMFRKLAALGLSHEQMAGVLEIFDTDAEARKEKARLRVQKWRSNQKLETLRNVTEHNVTLHEGSREGARVEDNLLGKDISGKETNKQNARKRAVVPSDFDDWYRHYPHKVQRGAAEKAFAKARQVASLDELLQGALRYVQSKPADHAWRNPATWLNGKGWLDAPAPEPLARGPPSLSVRPRNVVEALETIRRKRSESDSRECDNDDVECLPADPARSRTAVGNVVSALRFDDDGGYH